MLSIVVIGKNEAKNIGRCAQSIDLFANQCGVSTQAIYVDSASSDGSFEIATNYFDEVYQLSESPWLCASSGRYIGTSKSKYDWILFLDADMELLPGFSKNIVELLKDNNYSVGFVGNYIHVFDDGRKVSQLSITRKGNTNADYFGGAILIRKKALLDAGSWDPSLFSNEELELYSRLCNGIKCVSYVDIPMVHHFTTNSGKFISLLGYFFPSLGLGKKYYGFGQLIRSALIKKNIINIIKMWPHPFVCWALLVLSMLSLSVGYIKVGCFFLLCGIIYIVLKTQKSNLILYLALLPQTILGYRKYNPNYCPQIKKELIVAREVSASHI